MIDARKYGANDAYAFIAGKSPAFSRASAMRSLPMKASYGDLQVEIAINSQTSTTRMIRRVTRSDDRNR
jgi:hypothetical protein